MIPAIKARTIIALGLANAARVAAYRLGLKTGLSSARRVSAEAATGPFFTGAAQRPDRPPPSMAWRDEAHYFGSRTIPLAGNPPDWFLNPYTGRRLEPKNRNWWSIPDFDPEIGDVKIIWEPSRFDWLLAAAERASTGDDDALDQIESWLQDWCLKNPPYKGPNWKCGQEASIRVMHLAMTALVLDSHLTPTAALLELIETHLKRIAPTIQYAIGQDNNHGTSEAAALFIGGTWLAANGHPQGPSWARTGRRLLENRLSRLVAEDGRFSQYSLTYHRLLLDTGLRVEAWRLRCGLPEFSDNARIRMKNAAYWLHAMIDQVSGDGPNLGANDGARLMPLTDSGYRDFRPTLQTAMALFAGKRAIGASGAWDWPLAWLGLNMPADAAAPPVSAQFDQGGYAVLRQNTTLAILRYPRFRFRPSQADALHVDLWVNGQNMLRDSGTFSYNTDSETLDRFAGVRGHNTIAFDNRNQMPRLGRFLYGAWLSAKQVSFDAAKGKASAAYTDWLGASHCRDMELSEKRLTTVDRISGQFSSATLRWRLAPGDWVIDANSVVNGDLRLTISSDANIVRFDLVEGEESLFYLVKQAVPVLEVEVRAAGEIISEFSWS